MTEEQWHDWRDRLWVHMTEHGSRVLTTQQRVSFHVQVLEYLERNFASVARWPQWVVLVHDYHRDRLVKWSKEMLGGND